MSILTNIIARVLYVLPIFVFGLMHFMNAKDMAGMVPSWLPGTTLIVYITGLALVAAAVSIVSGKMAKLGALLLGILLVMFALTVHLPGMGTEDPMMAQVATTNFFKDLGLAGAAFFLSGYFAREEEKTA